jgi:NTP pyrophosphatase (non-canonical NTP hydrolase)
VKADGLRFAELRRTNVRRCRRHYHHENAWSLSDWLMCVTGELGELAGEIKKLRRKKAERRRNKHAIGATSKHALGAEAADVIIYLDLLCARAGVDLGAAVREKFDLVSRERLGSRIRLPRPR